jgi:hypothetical protein
MGLGFVHSFNITIDSDKPLKRHVIMLSISAELARAIPCAHHFSASSRAASRELLPCAAIAHLEIY